MQVKYWKYPWPNLWQIRNLIIHTGLEEGLVILFLLMVAATWEIHMVHMVVVVLHTTRCQTIQITYISHLQDCNV